MSQPKPPIGWVVDAGNLYGNPPPLLPNVERVMMPEPPTPKQLAERAAAEAKQREMHRAATIEAHRINHEYAQPLLRPILALHAPTFDEQGYGPECGECLQEDETYGGVEAAVWPCRTYKLAVELSEQAAGA